MKTRETMFGVLGFAVLFALVAGLAMAFVPSDRQPSDEPAVLDVFDDVGYAEGDTINLAAPTKTPAKEFIISYDHAQVTSDTTWNIWKAPRMAKIDYVEYLNPTGLAAAWNNYFNVQLLNSSTEIASWDTCAGGDGGTQGEGSIPANSFIELGKSATAANLRLAAGDTISLKADETGTATLPAGRVVVHGHFLQ